MGCGLLFFEYLILKMKKIITLLFVIGFLNIQAGTLSSHIKIFFTRPVDTTVSSGTPAKFVNQGIDDTLINYINRAKHTLDIAVYDYKQSAGISNIATAINNAYTRGVQVRWIYEPSISNAGLSQLNSAIPTTYNRAAGNFGIMHNKFMIIDANSSTPSDAYVWTGSCNWDEEQIDSDFNNIIIIQDQPLAQAYLGQFNQMWGSTGALPDTVNAKFSTHKTNLGQHSFTVDGIPISLYFSPSDNTNDHLLSMISSANSQMFFGQYAFTISDNADSIVKKINAGVYTAGIMDDFATNYTAYSTLSPVMGNMLRVYNHGSSIYHNKFFLVDACDLSSDPTLETGSHNWSQTADTKNDENALIIHDATVANIYYQAFVKDFAVLGGTLATCNLSSGINENTADAAFNLYPNPTHKEFVLATNSIDNSTFSLQNALGQTILSQNIASVETHINISHFAPGIYFVQLKQGDKTTVKQLVITQ